MRDLFVEGDREALAGAADFALLAAFNEAAAGTRERLADDGVPSDFCEQLRLDDGLVMVSAAMAWEAVDDLLTRGACINGRDRWGQTAMHFAVTNWLAAVHAVFERGGHAARRDWQFCGSPVGWADHGQRTAERDFLLDNAVLTPEDALLHRRFDSFDLAQIDGAPFHHPAWVGNVMRKHHPGQTHPSTEGMCLGDPLRAAAMYNDLEAVEWLLDHGAHTNLTEPRTGTFELAWRACSALEWALDNQNDKMVELLRAAGAEEPERCPSDTLFLAVLGGDVALARVQLEAGTDVNRVAPFDQQMRTPLCVGVTQGTAMTRLLIDAGANPRIPALFGKDAVHYAGNDMEILGLLKGC